MGDGDEGLDGVDVLLLHLRDARAGRQQGEARQGLDISITLQLQRRESKAPMRITYTFTFIYYVIYHAYIMCGRWTCTLITTPIIPARYLMKPLYFYSHWYLFKHLEQSMRVVHQVF